MNRMSQNYIFVDESGDPGKPFYINKRGEKTETGASKYYILTALPLTTSELFKIEEEIIQTKNKFGYKKEIKSTDVSLPLYKALLGIFKKLNLKIFYRQINKETYKGIFAVDGKKELNNVFDNYNLVKLVSFTVNRCQFLKTDVVIDRAERRLHNGKFDSFDNYLIRRINTKTLKKVEYVTHVSSEYVNVMQLVDLVSGAIKDCFTGKNKGLKKTIKANLVKIY